MKFFNQSDDRESVSLLLLDIKKDVASIAHKLNTLQGNVLDLNEVLYKADDSVMLRLKSMEAEIALMKANKNARTTLWVGLAVAFFTLILPNVLTVISPQNINSVQAEESKQ